jgi:WD40 repeat protein
VRFIFGRRAEQVRNNLKFDKYDRIIYSSGHAVVTVDPETNMKEFLYVKEDPIHCLQEVTALEISKDGEFLISCHAGTRSGVILWELNSKILLKRFYLKEIVQVLYVIISDDSERVVVYGITPSMVGQLVMIDVCNE